MSETALNRKPAQGAPAWVITFADLMSLLMCFFVLLLSFSEMDVSKYKEMAGSLKDAFGVQRAIRVKEPPKGINVIAREFSPGRPEPTHLNVIRQMTTNDLRVNLDLGKERRRPAPTPKPEQEPEQETSLEPRDSAQNQADDKAGERARAMPGSQGSQEDGLTPVQRRELAQAKALAARRLQEKLAADAQLQDLQQQRKAGKVSIDRQQLDKLLAARQAAAQRAKLNRSAKLISDALGREIEAGSVDVETAGQKIIIRVREKASFGSGRAELKDGFRPILARVAKILEGSDGKIIVAGHTDNVPIYTQRFRSNWELSAARAVSVAHVMMEETNIASDRFLIQGFADTEPVAGNDSAAERARNRRVEIILQQGEDRLSQQQISGATSTPRQATAPAPAVTPAAGPAGTGAGSGERAPPAAPRTLGIRAAGQ